MQFLRNGELHFSMGSRRSCARSAVENLEVIAEALREKL
jgi:hypothetical protein